MRYFEKVRGYLLELGYDIVREDVEEELFVITDEENGLLNVIIDCEDPILIIEMLLAEVKAPDVHTYQQLLQKNRDIVHGAFALDSDGKRLLFRDTLQLENLDLNELEGSLNALSLLISEYYENLIELSK